MTPSRRTPSRGGNNGRSRSRLVCSSAACVAGAAPDRLRVTCWKSAYFTLAVTVRPECPPWLHAAQTWASTGVSAGSTSSQRKTSRGVSKTWGATPRVGGPGGQTARPALRP